MGTGKHGLRLLALRDVHRDPDGALGWIGWVDGLAAHLADHGGPILAAQLQLALVGVAGGQLRIASAADLFPRSVAGVPPARGAAHQFTRLVAQHLLKVVVAAGQAPVAQEHDPHHCAVKEQLLFTHRCAQCSLRTLLLVDVVQDPDGTFGCVVRVDEPPGQAAPEQAAVAPAQLALDAERLALG
ncbi:hypothetical protein D3C72_1789970 [compost metagenome]